MGSAVGGKALSAGAKNTSLTAGRKALSASGKKVSSTTERIALPAKRASSAARGKSLSAGARNAASAVGRKGLSSSGRKVSSPAQRIVLPATTKKAGARNVTSAAERKALSAEARNAASAAGGKSFSAGRKNKSSSVRVKAAGVRTGNSIAAGSKNASVDKSRNTSAARSKISSATGSNKASISELKSASVAGSSPATKIRKSSAGTKKSHPGSKGLDLDKFIESKFENLGEQTLNQVVSSVRKSTMGDLIQFNTRLANSYKISDEDSLETIVYAHQPLETLQDKSIKPSVSEAQVEVSMYRDLLLLGNLPSITQQRRPYEWIQAASKLSTSAQVALMTSLLGMAIKLTGKVPSKLTYKLPGGKMKGKDKTEVVAYLALARNIADTMTEANDLNKTKELSVLKKMHSDLVKIVNEY